MIIYKCIICEDEMFSDAFKMKVSEDQMFYEVEGKIVTRTKGGIQGCLIGANASAEEPDESLEEGTDSGVDIILNHHLVETNFTKKEYVTYIKKYMKAVLEYLEKNNPDRVNSFKSSAQEAIKKIASDIDNYQFFIGPSMNPEGTVGLLNYREDGVTPYVLFFKDGLIEEKC